MSLTLKRIAKLAKSPGRYHCQFGLYLQVPVPGKKPRPARASWLFRYERNGRERWLGLGASHAYSLEEARELARKARQQLDQGIDPIDARRAERAAKALEAARILSFEQAAKQYFDAHERKEPGRRLPNRDPLAIEWIKSGGDDAVAVAVRMSANDPGCVKTRRLM
jgi:hypothetical protein